MKRIAIRATAIQLVTTVALLLLAQPASSAPAVPKGETFTLAFAAGEVCPFGVEITATSAQTERVTLPNGIVIITGPAVATVTNQDTDASETYNISGPTQFDPATGRVVVTGRNLIQAPAGSGGPFLIVTSGRVSFILGQPIDVPLRGHVSHNVCAELG
ncbi:hypothetical protein ACFPIJ_36290 [Dactylosporangium cerinum]|uniref:Uncharacterized protein n=1 Tax=Dactylosporangium cerinum TaxID=1434730 RepID=A0ABV9W6X5_9ACTN